MPGSSRPKGWMLVPPPLLFVLPLAAGLVLHRRFPLVRPAPKRARTLRRAGLALAGVGAAHFLSSVALFTRSRTTLVPHGRSSTLVTRGAYRWTRNPIYLGMTLGYLGVATAAAAVWPLVLLPLPLAVLDRRVIPAEERQLESAFGAAYTAYRRRVRRWL